MSISNLKLDELNTVETSVSTWQDFIDASMQSDFFCQAYEITGNIKKAASLTILDQYIRIFEESTSTEALEDEKVFYGYAKGFIEELAPYRYNKAGNYKADTRALFLGKIRKLLRQQKDKNNLLIDENRYEFIRVLIKFLSSLNYILQVYSSYKEYRFTILPQTRR